MKRFLSLLLAAIMLLGCIPAMAAEEPTWKVTSTTGNLKCTNSTKIEGYIEIPAEVDGIKVTGLQYMAFMGNKKITGMTIPDSVRFMDRGALTGMSEMKELILPKDLMVICTGNIRDFSGIESLIIPPSVLLIRGSIVNCANLKSVTFEGVCPLFPADDTYKTLHNLHPDCVIYVPNDQLDAYKAAFADDAEVLARIQPSGKNAVVVDWAIPESDFEFDAATGTITKYNGTAGLMNIPATIGGVAVTTIGERAFSGNHSIHVVNIPEGVEVLESSAFADCDGLVYVKFPTTLKTMEDYAFNSSNALWNVEWAEGLETIGKGVFAGGPSLWHVTLPTTVRTIGETAFNSTYIKTLTFGPNVESIGKKAFAGNQLTAITYTGTAMPQYGELVFERNTKDATLTLADGTSEEIYNAYVTMMATDFPTCVVNEPVGMVLSFPALEAAAAAPFIGSWHAVAGMDVMGDFTDDYPVVDAHLNADGTATIIVDGEENPSAWFIESGYALFAPVENGKPNAEGVYALANIDENGRLVFDLGYAAAICEQDGVVYAAPAIPEKPWPEFSLDDVKYFVGSWEAVSYTMGDETYEAAQIGPMVLTLNADGTATSAEPGEEPYALTWCQGDYYGTALVGETYNTAAALSFDGTGNLKMVQDGMTIILAPYVEAAPEPTAAPVDPANDTILGKWDDGAKFLDVYEDGRIELTYKSDGYVSKMEWEMVDGMPTIIKGIWKDHPITLENGLLIVTKDTLYQEFTRVGEAPAVIINGNQAGADGEDEEEYEYEIPEAAPIGPEGEPYFGTWKMDLGGMAMILTLNQDGTCAMEMMGESEPGVWTMKNGKAYIMDDESHIDGNGNLVTESGMVFVKTEDASSGSKEMSEEEALLAFLAMLGQMEGGEDASLAPEAPVDYIPATMDDYIGGWICADDPSIQMLLLEGEATLIEDGVGYPAAWTVEDGIAIIDGMKLYTQEDWSGILDMDGELIKFERGYVEKPKASAATDNSGSDEMSEEELLALMALLGQMAESQEAELPEHLQAYVGTWHMVYIATGGWEGDMRTIGVTGKLELNADGTGKLSGAADDSGKWYDDEGTVRFGQAEAPLTLLDGGFLRYGNQLSGYMVFSQDATATWSPAPPATPVPTAAPAAAPAAGFNSYEDYLGTKFVATTYTSGGQKRNASELGAEYSVIFYANGKCDFTMAGVTTPGLSWGLQKVGLGLTQVDAFVVAYYTVSYNFIPTETGFDMDFYGSMNLHFVPAE